MKLIDSHCHLDVAPLAAEIETVIANARVVGVHGFIIPGITAFHWEKLLLLGSLHTGVYCAAGLHPLFLDHHHNRDLSKLKGLCLENKLVGIGEIGLDFYDGRQQETQQQQLFEQQLAIANKANLPIILHVRKAHDQVLATLRRKHFTQGGTVHAFNGSYQQAEKYIELGFAIGIGGAITYDRATKMRAVASQLPEQSIVLETDSPDMVIAGKKQGPNLPQYLPEILEILAKLRNQSSEHLATTTCENTRNIFRLKNE
ncbi:MAG: TatD DNase family protein [Desulforhopalus sp.]|jgi:TatD DNase family protein